MPPKSSQRKKRKTKCGAPIVGGKCSNRLKEGEELCWIHKNKRALAECRETVRLGSGDAIATRDLQIRQLQEQLAQCKSLASGSGCEQAVQRAAELESQANQRGVQINALMARVGELGGLLAAAQTERRQIQAQYDNAMATINAQVGQRSSQSLEIKAGQAASNCEAQLQEVNRKLEGALLQLQESQKTVNLQVAKIREKEEQYAQAMKEADESEAAIKSVRKQCKADIDRIQGVHNAQVAGIQAAFESGDTVAAKRLVVESKQSPQPQQSQSWLGRAAAYTGGLLGLGGRSAAAQQPPPQQPQPQQPQPKPQQRGQPARSIEDELEEEQNTDEDTMLTMIAEDSKRRAKEAEDEAARLENVKKAADEETARVATLQQQQQREQATREREAKEAKDREAAETARFRQEQEVKAKAAAEEAKAARQAREVQVPRANLGTDDGKLTQGAGPIRNEAQKAVALDLIDKKTKKDTKKAKNSMTIGKTNVAAEVRNETVDILKASVTEGWKESNITKMIANIRKYPEGAPKEHLKGLFGYLWSPREFRKDKGKAAYAPNQIQEKAVRLPYSQSVAEALFSRDEIRENFGSGAKFANRTMHDRV